MTNPDATPAPRNDVRLTCSCGVTTVAATIPATIAFADAHDEHELFMMTPVAA